MKIPAHWVEVYVLTAVAVRAATHPGTPLNTIGGVVQEAMEVYRVLQNELQYYIKRGAVVRLPTSPSDLEGNNEGSPPKSTYL